MQHRPDANFLIDLIYSALLGERPWQDFVDEMCHVLPNGKALLFFHDATAGAGAFALNAGFDADVGEAYRSHYSSLNPWMHGAATRPLGHVVRADAMLPREQLARTEFYNDFLRHQEVETGLGVTVLREQHCNFMLSVLSADADDATYDEAMACVQALVPHLQRAFNWYRKNQTGVPALITGGDIGESLRAGIITVGAGRKVRAANDVAERLLMTTPGLSIDCSGRFRCAMEAVTDCLDTMLSSWRRSLAATPPASFLLPRGDRPQPLRISIIAPPGDEETAFFRGPECIVLLEDPSGDLDIAAQEFGSLYRLTAAETRVVAGLAEGHTLDEIAARGGTSVETVRKQLKHVFAKTGTSRQADLVRNVCLLAGTMLNRSS